MMNGEIIMVRSTCCSNNTPISEKIMFCWKGETRYLVDSRLEKLLAVCTTCSVGRSDAS